MEEEGVLGEADEETGEVLPTEQEGENETFRTVPEVSLSKMKTDESPNALSNECYPKDVLTPQDLHFTGL